MARFNLGKRNNYSLAHLLLYIIQLTSSSPLIILRIRLLGQSVTFITFTFFSGTRVNQKDEKNRQIYLRQSLQIASLQLKTFFHTSQNVISNNENFTFRKSVHSSSFVFTGV